MIQASKRPPSPVSAILPFVPPYDWPGMIAFFAARAVAGLEEVSADRYSRSFVLGAAAGTISVTPSGPSALQLAIRCEDPDVIPAIVARLRRMFDLDSDPAAVTGTLSADPDLAPLVATRPGLRVPGGWDPFELAVRAILGQQVKVSAARALGGKLVTKYGTLLPAGDSGITHAFPDPARLADAVDLGRVIGTPRSRAVAIVALARAAADNAALFAPGGGLEATVARLRKLPGIGDWTAQYIAMRAMREPDAFPAPDIGLRRAMETGAARPDAAALIARAERWRPWRAYAAQYLWTRDAAAPP